MTTTTLRRLEERAADILRLDDARRQLVFAWADCEAWRVIARDTHVMKFGRPLLCFCVGTAVGASLVLITLLVGGHI